MPSSTTGVLWIHSAPLALQPHLQWAVARFRDPETARAIRVSWRTHEEPQQPKTPARTTISAEIEFTASLADALAVADNLSGWPQLYFELAIDAAEGGYGQRICHTPELGTFQADTDAVGNVVLNENVLRSMMAGSEEFLRDGLDAALGGPWDRILEPMRLATAGYEVCDLEPEAAELSHSTDFGADEDAVDDSVVVKLYPRRAVM